MIVIKILKKLKLFDYQMKKSNEKIKWKNQMKKKELEMVKQ